MDKVFIVWGYKLYGIYTTHELAEEAKSAIIRRLCSQHDYDDAEAVHIVEYAVNQFPSFSYEDI